MFRRFGFSIVATLVLLAALFVYRQREVVLPVGNVVPSPAQPNEVNRADDVHIEVPRETSQLAAAEAIAETPTAVHPIVAETNAFRSAQKLPKLKQNAELMAAAEYFANFMATEEKYGHTADGREPGERATEYGYDYCLIAENIAYRSDCGASQNELAAAFVEQWINSPPHLENLRNPNYTEIGAAVARNDSTQTYYSVQMFGRPSSLMFEITIVNDAGAAVFYQIDTQTFELKPRYTMVHQLCVLESFAFFAANPDTQEKAESFAKVTPQPNQSLAVVRREGSLSVVSRTAK